MGRLLKSRKFWASVVGLVAIIILHVTGEDLPVDQVVDGILAIVGVYVGSVAIEDGLTAMGGSRRVDQAAAPIERRVTRPDVRTRD